MESSIDWRNSLRGAKVLKKSTRDLQGLCSGERNFGIEGNRAILIESDEPHVRARKKSNDMQRARHR
jgi:hypothetical protein